MRSSVKVWQLLVAMAVTFVLAAVGVAVATIPDGDGVIHGCYKKSGNNKGMVRVIDTAVTVTCPTGFAPLNWNQQGPPGPQGIQGPAGSAADAATADQINVPWVEACVADFYVFCSPPDPSQELAASFFVDPLDYPEDATYQIEGVFTLPGSTEVCVRLYDYTLDRPVEGSTVCRQNGQTGYRWLAFTTAELPLADGRHRYSLQAMLTPGQGPEGSVGGVLHIDWD